MVAVTSGTVDTMPYDQRRVLDHSFRRAGYLPQRVSAEAITIAQELLFTLLAEWCNAATPLWTIYYTMLSATVGSADVLTPIGTVETLHAYWRILMPYRGSCTLSTGANDSTLFAGQPCADVPLAGPNPGVTVDFGTPTELDTIGVLLGGSASVTAALEVYTSDDGATYALFQTLPLASYISQIWTYFDLSPTAMARSVRLQMTGANPITLNQLNFGLANGVDVELGVENIDSYHGLPNKAFRSDRPNTVYQDRRVFGPVLKLWPTPSVPAFYNGTVTALLRRQIMDPGQMSNKMSVPSRWLEALQWRLAVTIMDEIPPALLGQVEPKTALELQSNQQRYIRVQANAVKSEALAWGEERNKSPLRLTPSISPYTR